MPRLLVLCILLCHWQVALAVLACQLFRVPVRRSGISRQFHTGSNSLCNSPSHSDSNSTRSSSISSSRIKSRLLLCSSQGIQQQLAYRPPRIRITRSLRIPLPVLNSPRIPLYSRLPSQRPGPLSSHARLSNRNRNREST